MSDNYVILKDIPVDITLNYFERVSKSKSKGAINMYKKYINIANEYAKPKSVIKWCDAHTLDDENVVIENIQFKSKLLSDKLKNTSRVFACAITSGYEIKNCELIPNEAVRDIMAGAVLDIATKYTLNYLKENFDIESSALLQPGSLPDWPISNNKILFDIIGKYPTESIELSLTDSGYMLPWNSLSGIIFADNSGYKNCSLCKRENCIGRRSEFNQTEYTRIFGK